MSKHETWRTRLFWEETGGVLIEEFVAIEGNLSQGKRLMDGMYLLGQAYFSKFIIENHQPKSTRTVAICGKNDLILGEFAKKHGVEIVEYPDKMKK
jgi:hypothetical protein